MTTRTLLFTTLAALALSGCGGHVAAPDAPPPPPDGAPDAEPPAPPPTPHAALGAAAGRLSSTGYTLDVFLGDPTPAQRLSSSNYTLTPTAPVEP
jgi:hypothetical protein